MKVLLLISTHLWAFVIGIKVSEYSARHNHEPARAAGRWLRSWFM